jgi:hypothetical protein
MKKPINEIAKMRRIAGLITESEYQEALQEENKFYSRDYVSQKYGNKAKEIEDNIEDENPNVWDMYTSLETPEEVDEFVSGYLDEVLQEKNQSLSSQDILKLLANNGIDDDYLEDMGGIESGSDEWLDTLSDLTGKDAYEMSIDDSWDEKDNEKIMNLIDTLENMGIELV